MITETEIPNTLLRNCINNDGTFKTMSQVVKTFDNEGGARTFYRMPNFGKFRAKLLEQAVAEYKIAGEKFFKVYGY